MKVLSLLTVLLLAAGCGGPTKRCLVSPVAGTITAEGKPVKGATVIRKYYSHWYREQVETITHTDDSGNFAFEGVWKKAVLDVLHQPVIQEQISIEHEGNHYKILDIAKMDYELCGEMTDIPAPESERSKDRLTKQNGKLRLKFDLATDRAPIGRSKDLVR